MRGQQKEHIFGVDECRFSKCKDKGVHVRGLCQKHYRKIARSVRDDKTTWGKAADELCDGIQYVDVFAGRPKLERNSTCMLKGCGKPTSIRGLCTSHYATALAQVTKRKVTWDQLVEAGLATESTTAGIGPITKFANEQVKKKSKG